MDERATVSKEKRTALLRYLEILFLVAFALVAISLIVHSRTTISSLSETGASMMERAERLQTENRELQEKVAALQTDVAAAKAGNEDTAIAYEALCAVLASPYTDQTLEHSREIETVYNYRDFYSAEAWQLFEAYLAQVRGTPVAQNAQEVTP